MYRNFGKHLVTTESKPASLFCYGGIEIMYRTV